VFGLRPAGFCVNQQALCLDQTFFTVCYSALRFDQLLTVLPKHVPLPLQFLLGFSLQCLHLCFLFVRRNQFLTRTTELVLQLGYLGRLGAILALEMGVNLLNLGVEAVF